MSGGTDVPTRLFRPGDCRTIVGLPTLRFVILRLRFNLFLLDFQLDMELWCNCRASKKLIANFKVKVNCYLIS